jgi:hypothetical protein
MKQKLIEFLELEKVIISEPWVAMKFGDEIGVYQGPVKRQRGSLSYKSFICMLEDPDISDLPTVRLRQLAEFIAQSRTIAPQAVQKSLEAAELLERAKEEIQNIYGRDNDLTMEIFRFLEDFNND